MPVIKIRCSYLRSAAFAFLLLPVLIFLYGFVKLIFAVPVSLLLLAAYIFALRDGRENTDCVQIPLLRLILFGLICLVWCWLGGQGNLFYQTADWNERNAIFRDLIRHSWPVYYPDNNTSLVYYIGHWLPAASVGKLFYLLTANLELSFAVGNLFLALWTFIGIFTVVLQLLALIRPGSGTGQWLALVLFIGFSGLDILGTVIMRWPREEFLSRLHLEWWANRYQFSANTTCLFWVFNQAVPAWVATLCFLQEKSCRNYAFLVGCALISAPFPCVGLGILMVGKAACAFVSNFRQKQLRAFFREIFSFSNTVTALFWVPIIGAYFLSNSTINISMGQTGSAPAASISRTMILFSFVILAAAGMALVVWLVVSRVLRKKSPFFPACSLLLAVSAALLYLFPTTGFSYFVFLALECGIYWLLVATENHKNPLFYFCGLVFLLAPCIRVGFSADFCMRASIPALLILMILCAKKLCACLEAPKTCSRWQKVTSLVLVFFLILGMATPAMEVFRGVYKTGQAGTVLLPADSIYTLGKFAPNGGAYSNFIAENPAETLFFQVFSSLT